MTDVERLRATVASYSGCLRHGASWSDWERAWQRFPWLGHLLEHDGWQLAARWPPPAWRAQRAVRYGALYRRATASAGARCLVFWPAGRFIEFHGPQRLVAEAVLGLRRVRLARGDYALTAGFPARLAPRFAVRAPQAQCSVVAVGQRRPWRSATAPTRVPIAVLLTRSSLSWVCGVDR